MTELEARLAPNWTSAAGALEGVLHAVGGVLPRHALMGITGHAWHFCLGSREGIVALPSGPSDLDREAMLARWSRTGWRFQRFAARLADGGDGERRLAVTFATTHLDAGRPLVGWDFHLHEYGVVYGYDSKRRGFFVDDILTPESGPFVEWAEWPALGEIELYAPVEFIEQDAVEVVGESLASALLCFAGGDGPDDGQPRGTAGLDAWADALDGETEIDRSGNAYTLAVLQAARLDGAEFLADVAAAIPELGPPLGAAVTALREQTKALAPLLTLFPFPSGGHGNVANAGLRRAAAMALRRVAQHERHVATALREALDILEA